MLLLLRPSRDPVSSAGAWRSHSGRSSIDGSTTDEDSEADPGVAGVVGGAAEAVGESSVAGGVDADAGTVTGVDVRAGVGERAGAGARAATGGDAMKIEGVVADGARRVARPLSGVAQLRETEVTVYDDGERVDGVGGV